MTALPTSHVPPHFAFPNLASQLPKAHVAIIVPRRDVMIRPGITLTVETLDTAAAEAEMDLLHRALNLILQRLGLRKRKDRRRALK